MEQNKSNNQPAGTGRIPDEARQGGQSPEKDQNTSITSGDISEIDMQEGSMNNGETGVGMTDGAEGEES